MATETATLGGGCFWCLEAVFDQMRGVVSVESGYMGGHVANPTYREVCTATTGHAEVVQIAFDTEETSFAEILEVFFAIHDPTTRDQQGNDVGPQYRSVIFHHTPEQKRIAVETIAGLDYGAPMVTEVSPVSTFYVAEDYHQEYFANNAYQPYCQYVVAPKVRKFLTKFEGKVRG